MARTVKKKIVLTLVGIYAALMLCIPIVLYFVSEDASPVKLSIVFDHQNHKVSVEGDRYALDKVIYNASNVIIYRDEKKYYTEFFRADMDKSNRFEIINKLHESSTLSFRYLSNHVLQIYFPITYPVARVNLNGERQYLPESQIFIVTKNYSPYDEFYVDITYNKPSELKKYTNFMGATIIHPISGALQVTGKFLNEYVNEVGNAISSAIPKLQKWRINREIAAKHRREEQRSNFVLVQNQLEETYYVGQTSGPIFYRLYDGYGKTIQQALVHVNITRSPLGSHCLLQVPNVVMTDSSGAFGIQLLMGQKPGKYSVTMAYKSKKKTHEFRVYAEKPSKLINMEKSYIIRASVGRDLVNAFKVKVLDAFNNSVPGAVVDYYLITAQTSPNILTSVQADTHGIAKINFSVNERSETVAIVAQLRHTEEKVVFRVQSKTEPPAELKDIGEPERIGTVGLPLKSPIQVLVADKYGNPVPNINITFTLTDVDGEFVAESLSKSKGDGIATAKLVLPSEAGDYDIAASDPNLEDQQISYHLLMKPGNEIKLDDFRGDEQIIRVGHEIPEVAAFKVVDQAGNSLPDVKIAWTADDALKVMYKEDVTDQQGLTRATVKGLKAGKWALSAKVGTVIKNFHVIVQDQSVIRPVVISQESIVALADQKSDVKISVAMKDQYGQTFPNIACTLVYSLQQKQYRREYQISHKSNDNGIVTFQVKTPLHPQTVDLQFRYEKRELKPQITWSKIDFIPADLARLVFSKERYIGVANHHLENPIEVALLDVMDKPVKNVKVDLRIIKTPVLPSPIPESQSRISRIFLRLVPNKIRFASLRGGATAACTNNDGKMIFDIYTGQAAGDYVLEASVGSLKTLISVTVIPEKVARLSWIKRPQKTVNSGAFIDGNLLQATDKFGNVVNSTVADIFIEPINRVQKLSRAQTQTLQTKNRDMTFSFNAPLKEGRFYVFAIDKDQGKIAKTSIDVKKLSAARISWIGHPKYDLVVNTVVKASFPVRVTDPHGNLISNELVFYRLTDRNGKELYEYRVSTNADGLAIALLQLPKLSADYILQAGIQGGKVAINQGVVVRAAFPVKCDVLAGDNQYHVIGNKMAEAIKLQLKDEFDNVVPEYPIIAAYYIEKKNLRKNIERNLKTDSLGCAQFNWTGAGDPGVREILFHVKGSDHWFKQTAYTKLIYKDADYLEINIPPKEYTADELIKHVIVRLMTKNIQKYQGESVQIDIFNEDKKERIAGWIKTMPNNGALELEPFTIHEQGIYVIRVRLKNIEGDRRFGVIKRGVKSIQYVNLKNNRLDLDQDNLLISIVFDQFRNQINVEPFSYEIIDISNNILQKGISQHTSENAFLLSISKIINEGFYKINTYPEKKVFSSTFETFYSSRFRLQNLDGNFVATAGIQANGIFKVKITNGNLAIRPGLNFTYIMDDPLKQRFQGVTNKDGIILANLKIPTKIGVYHIAGVFPDGTSKPIGVLGVSPNVASTIKIFNLINLIPAGKRLDKMCDVSVKDTYGNPVPHYKIEMGSFRIGTANVVYSPVQTDAKGVFTVGPLQAPFTMGSYILKVRSVEFPEIIDTCTFNVVAGDFYQLETPQIRELYNYCDQVMTSPIEVKASDFYYNPASNISVNFTIFPIKTSQVLFTDVEGKANYRLKGPSKPGSYTLKISVNGRMFREIKMKTREQPYSLHEKSIEKGKEE